MDGIVAPVVERYLDELTHLQHDDPVLDEMEQHARRLEFPIVGRAVGRFLELQARGVGARRAFELGSGFGYSAYWFARAVGVDGEVICTDLDPQNAAAGQRFLTHAGLWPRVSYRVGDAAEALIGTDGTFDVIFCDADKQRYPDHWRVAAERVRPGGLYLCDNTLWYGRAATGEPTPERPGWTEAIREHNRLVAEDRRFVSAVLPLRDGVLVALRVA
ncbi:MAG TPA: O-methyltransferase [Nitriliruptorales bacterium]|nr:O-methyltransferase [Nitriliruptorales bacterium]